MSLHLNLFSSNLTRKADNYQLITETLKNNNPKNAVSLGNDEMWYCGFDLKKKHGNPCQLITTPKLMGRMQRGGWVSFVPHSYLSLTPPSPSHFTALKHLYNQGHQGDAFYCRSTT